MLSKLTFGDKVDVGEKINAIELLRDRGGVRDENERNVFFAARVAQHVDDDLLIADVDVRSRFVRQHEFRLISERARDGDALLFADAHLARFMVKARPQSDAFQKFDRAFFIMSAPRERHPELDVFKRRETRKEIKRLENVADASRAELVAFGFR